MIFRTYDKSLKGIVGTLKANNFKNAFSEVNISGDLTKSLQNDTAYMNDYVESYKINKVEALNELRKNVSVDVYNYVNKNGKLDDSLIESYNTNSISKNKIEFLSQDRGIASASRLCFDNQSR